ncbi:DeoR/GlpR transcriptional regulator, partial [Cutibacterium acnes]
VDAHTPRGILGQLSDLGVHLMVVETPAPKS